MKTQYVYGALGTIGFQWDKNGDMRLAYAIKNPKDKSFPKKVVRAFIDNALTSGDFITLSLPKLKEAFSIERMAGFFSRRIKLGILNWPSKLRHQFFGEALCSAILLAEFTRVNSNKVSSQLEEDIWTLRNEMIFHFPNIITFEFVRDAVLEWSYQE